MNFLNAILEHTRGEVALRKSRVPAHVLHERPLYERTPLSLSAALRKNPPAVIAEIKKASPSRGVICHEFDPARIARRYEAAGACAISVLTEEKYFLGSLEDLESARRATRLPILRKDFILDPYQIHEAKSAGADAVLLIAAALGPGELPLLMEEARSLGRHWLRFTPPENSNRSGGWISLSSGSTTGTSSRSKPTHRSQPFWLRSFPRGRSA